MSENVKSSAWRRFFPDVRRALGYRVATREASAASFILCGVIVLKILALWPFNDDVINMAVLVATAIAAFFIGAITLSRPNFYLHIILCLFCAREVIDRLLTNKQLGLFIMMLLFMAAVNGVRAGIQYRRHTNEN
jgi:hypothetical protein